MTCLQNQAMACRLSKGEKVRPPQYHYPGARHASVMREGPAAHNSVAIEAAYGRRLTRGRSMGKGICCGCSEFPSNYYFDPPLLVLR